MTSYVEVMMTSSHIGVIFCWKLNLGLLICAGEEIFRISWNSIFYSLFHNSQPLVLTLGHIHSIYALLYVLISSFHLLLGFLSGFLTKILYEFRVSPKDATCSTPVVNVKFLLYTPWSRMKGIYARVAWFIVNFRTRWRCVVNLGSFHVTPGNEPRYLPYIMLGEPQSQYERVWRNEKSVTPCRDSKSDRPSSALITVPTTLPCKKEPVFYF
jgi:hypothetical protein